MKELELIAREVANLRSAGKSAVLATVVSIQGSSYRLPGARMLIADTTWMAGSVSGGCLEGDVVLRAREVLENNAAITVTYDTTSDEDIVFGVGLGCRGIIRVLIEPVTPRPGRADLVAFIRNTLETRQPGMVATVIGVEGRPDVKLAQRLLRDASGRVESDISDGALRAAISAHAEHAQATGASSSRSFDLPAGQVEVFFEFVRPPVPLVVFGAGHDAIPLVRMAKELGWDATVVDHRPAYVTTERFPLADRLIVWSEGDFPADVRLDRDTLALVMTHNFLRDLKLIKTLLPSPVRYVGVLGPKRRAGELIAELDQESVAVTPEQRRRLYAPVGLDIGAEGPEAVALSVLAEMQAVIAQRTPGHLRARKGSIHGLDTGRQPSREEEQA